MMVPAQVILHLLPTSANNKNITKYNWLLNPVRW